MRNCSPVSWDRTNVSVLTLWTKTKFCLKIPCNTMCNEMRQIELIAHVCPGTWTKFNELSEHTQEIYEYKNKSCVFTVLWLVWKLWVSYMNFNEVRIVAARYYYSIIKLIANKSINWGARNLLFIIVENKWLRWSSYLFENSALIFEFSSLEVYRQCKIWRNFFYCLWLGLYRKNMTSGKYILGMKFVLRFL
jgi:hypothetical protein